MSAGKICTRITHTATVDEAARAGAARMAQHGVGTLVVIDEKSRPIGLLTDRDLAIRVVAEGLDAESATVGEIMSKPVHSVGVDAAIESALSGMAGAGVRRAVVVDADGKLAGILALDDVLELLAEEAQAIGALVRGQAAS